MKRGAGVLSILLVFIATGALAEVTTVLVKNPDTTVTKIFYSEGKEVAQQVQDSKGKITKTTGTIPDGVVKEYLDNGALHYDWNYKSGKLEGISKEYFISGEVLEDMLYKNNVREGVSKKYYKSGKLLGERSFKQDQLQGVTKMYYEGGTVFAELNYKDGQLDGESKMYFEDGKIKVIETYSNGQKARLKAFDPQGNVAVDHDYTAEPNPTVIPPPAQPQENKKAGKPPAQPQEKKKPETPPSK
jgi:antitoxin component YwqK of YwqJK toxin-antitoxin module